MSAVSKTCGQATGCHATSTLPHRHQRQRHHAHRHGDERARGQRQRLHRQRLLGLPHLYAEVRARQDRPDAQPGLDQRVHRLPQLHRAGQRLGGREVELDAADLRRVPHGEPRLLRDRSHRSRRRAPTPARAATPTTRWICGWSTRTRSPSVRRPTPAAASTGATRRVDSRPAEQDLRHRRRVPHRQDRRQPWRGRPRTPSRARATTTTPPWPAAPTPAPDAMAPMRPTATSPSTTRPRAASPAPATPRRARPTYTGDHECVSCHNGNFTNAPDVVSLAAATPNGHYNETTHTASGLSDPVKGSAHRYGLGGLLGLPQPDRRCRHGCAVQPAPGTARSVRRHHMRGLPQLQPRRSRPSSRPIGPRASATRATTSPRCRPPRSTVRPLRRSTGSSPIACADRRMSRHLEPP